MTEKGFKNDPGRTNHDPKCESESAFTGDSYTESQICTETENILQKKPTTQKDSAQNVKFIGVSERWAVNAKPSNFVCEYDYN